MLKALLDQVRLTWRMLRDPRGPLLVKFLPFLPLIYVLSPLDFLPDFIPVIGQIDDVTILFLGMRLMETLAPQELVLEHRLAIERGAYASGEDVIEGKAKRVDR